MPTTRVVIYQESNGSVPLVEWLDGLPARVRDKCIVLIELLAERGHELRRPHCDQLDDGIYELRARLGNVHYRILYGFVGENIVLLSHGCRKEKRVPKNEIRRAITTLEKYAQDSETHTYRETLL